METQAVGTRGGAHSQSQVFRFGQIRWGRAASANTAMGSGRGGVSPELWRSHRVSEGQGLPCNRARISLPLQTSRCLCFWDGCLMLYLLTVTTLLAGFFGGNQRTFLMHALQFKAPQSAPSSPTRVMAAANLLKSLSGRAWTPPPESVAQSKPPRVHGDTRVRC